MNRPFWKSHVQTSFKYTSCPLLDQRKVQLIQHSFLKASNMPQKDQNHDTHCLLKFSIRLMGNISKKFKSTCTKNSEGVNISLYPMACFYWQKGFLSAEQDFFTSQTRTTGKGNWLKIAPCLSEKFSVGWSPQKCINYNVHCTDFHCVYMGLVTNAASVYGSRKKWSYIGRQLSSLLTH